MEALGRWDREEYAAGYRARFSGIPALDNTPDCWSCGWEDADTKLLESARHQQAISEGREDDFPGTWMLLFDAGGDALVNAIPVDDTQAADSALIQGVREIYSRAPSGYLIAAQPFDVPDPEGFVVVS
jgi:hypothetical protein